MREKNTYLLAIDGGTQSTKIVIFDIYGTPICAHSVKLRPMNLYHDGRAEHPDDDLWDSLKQACLGLFEKFQGDRNAIIGVGLGSIRCCRCLIKENGDLAAPVQSWMDLRLSAPYQQEHENVRYVTATTGYLTYRMTGETKDTRANYVGPWPVDPFTLDWFTDKKRFDGYNIPKQMLFDLMDPASVIGTVNEFASKATGIPEGVPVVTTANDKAVEALGAGLVDDDRLLVSLGTYITAMMIGDNNDLDCRAYWKNPSAIPGAFLYETNGIRRGMATVTWLKELLGGDIVEAAARRGVTPEDYLNLLAADVPVGCDGLYTILNFLARPEHLHERGMMIGFNGTHRGPHMFRSILEGIAMTMKNHAQAMYHERGVKPQSIIVSGGGANGDVFMQIFADVFAVPACRNEINDSAAMGAALSTALALGVYQNPREAIKHMVRRKDTFLPIAEQVSLYRRINEEVYRDIAQCTDALLRRSDEIFTSRRA